MIDVFMDSGSSEMYRLEAVGVRLVETIIARASLVGATTGDRRIHVVGPDFEYRTSPRLFAGRVGRGALRIAMDTNLLIDYFEHGHSMWMGESVTKLHTGEYGEHLEALQLILAVWVLRDIEFVMLKESLRDSKRRKLAPHLDQRNRKAWTEFYSALTHSPYHSEDRTDAAQRLPSRLIDRVIDAVPAGGDQRMVRAALNDGAHVYLTRDKRVLRASDQLRPFGLSAMTPGDLLDALSRYGALNFLWDPTSLYWPLPDQEKVAHMIWALPKRGENG
ncbi:hypothetical protein [Microbacterium sp. NPDC087591]|uniref:hypothetical protein n=1 Tax=Microbacterium sp. NPDC087591 TaxID=3364192 RepID=UPI00380AFF82